MPVKPIRFFVFGLCLLTFVSAAVISASHARAQTLLKPTKLSTLGFVYHKMSGTRPDFRSWAREWAARETQEMLARDRAIATRQRAGQWMAEFDDFKLQDKLLVLNGSLSLEVYSDIEQKLLVPVFAPHNFVPYDVYGLNLALVIRNIDDYHHLRIEDESAFQQIKNSLPHKSENAIMEILARPLKVDSDQKFSVGGKEYHLMMVEPAEIRIVLDMPEKPVIFHERAPWYHPETQLNQLYHQR